jgi:undecaprenyl-diphosphatase
VVAARVDASGSRPFIATAVDGRRYFVKVIGRDQRDADLLYRAYRLIRLRGVGDTRPAASLQQSAEHQALVGIMAEQAGVRAPKIERVAKAVDGSAVLAMELIDGTQLDHLSEQQLTHQLLSLVWMQVDQLHRAGIAHRALRAANVMVDATGQPYLVDFSFSELGAGSRQIAVDVAELLASLASLVGPQRAVASAVSVVGSDGLSEAVPLLQPLALSASTRKSVTQTPNLLKDTRVEAASMGGTPPDQLAQIQRVRPRNLLIIAALAGAFYFLLPQLAQVGNSWKAFQSADLVWVPVIVAMSMLTYVFGNIAIMGTVPQRLAFIPTLLTQSASSFVNRVSPANIGGMALNVRYLQKSGTEPPAAVAAVGLNSLAGFVAHVVLIVIFFAWSGNNLTKAFHLPSSSTVLLVVSGLVAVAGIVMATRWGRHKLLDPLIKAVRSSGANLRQVAASPLKLAMLFGGSVGVTLAYIGALVATTQAFGGGVSVAKVGVVYLAASAVAAAAPTPGGLGPLEAALVAGLTGVGMPGGPAVSAVLTYRLATYWLPVLPGWLSWQVLMKRGYV